MLCRKPRKLKHPSTSQEEIYPALAGTLQRLQLFLAALGSLQQLRLARLALLRIPVRPAACDRSWQSGSQGTRTVRSLAGVVLAPALTYCLIQRLCGPSAFAPLLLPPRGTQHVSRKYHMTRWYSEGLFACLFWPASTLTECCHMQRIAHPRGMTSPLFISMRPKLSLASASLMRSGWGAGFETSVFACSGPLPLLAPAFPFFSLHGRSSRLNS